MRLIRAHQLVGKRWKSDGKGSHTHVQGAMPVAERWVDLEKKDRSTVSPAVSRPALSVKSTDGSFLKQSHTE